MQILLKLFNYKNKNISINHLLLTLQQKLTWIKSLNSFIFIAIKEMYCIQIINDVESTFDYNVSNKYETKFCRIYYRCVARRDLL